MKCILKVKVKHAIFYNLIIRVVKQLFNNQCTNDDIYSCVRSRSFIAIKNRKAFFINSRKYFICILSFPTIKRVILSFSLSKTTSARHLRRYFLDALLKDVKKPDNTISPTAFQYINNLFNKIEKKLEVLQARERKEQRLIQENPVLVAFWSWAETTKKESLSTPNLEMHLPMHSILKNSL